MDMLKAYEVSKGNSEGNTCKGDINTIIEKV